MATLKCHDTPVYIIDSYSLIIPKLPRRLIVLDLDGGWITACCRKIWRVTQITKAGLILDQGAVPRQWDGESTARLFIGQISFDSVFSDVKRKVWSFTEITWMISSMLTSLLSFPDDGSNFFGWMFLTKSVAEFTRETTSLENTALLLLEKFSRNLNHWRLFL